MKTIKILLVLIAGFISFNSQAQNFIFQASYLSVDSCCVSMKVTYDTPAASTATWTVDVIDENNQILQTLANADFNPNDNISVVLNLCNLAPGNYTFSFSPDIIPPGNANFPINIDIALCVVPVCVGVNPDFNIDVNCFDLVATDISSYTSTGNFTHVEWFLDDVSLGASLPGGSFSQTLPAGTYELCMDMFVFEDGICCNEQYCEEVIIDPCEETVVDFNYTSTACAIDFTNQSDYGCGTLNNVNWIIDDVIVSTALTSFNFEFNDLLDHEVCLEAIVDLADGSQCTMMYCEDVSVSGDCDDIVADIEFFSDSDFPTLNPCFSLSMLSTSTSTTNVTWFWGDGTSSVGTSNGMNGIVNFHSYDTDGTYFVTVVATFNPTCDSTLCCVRTFNDTVVVKNCNPAPTSSKSTSLGDDFGSKFLNVQKDKIKVFPNSIQNGEELKIELSKKENTIQNVQILNLKGQIVLSESFIDFNNSVIINTESIQASGNYFVIVQDSNGISSATQVLVK